MSDWPFVDLFCTDVDIFPERLSLFDCSIALNISFDKAVSLVKSGELPCVTICGQPFIERCHVIDYIQAQVLASIDEDKLKSFRCSLTVSQVADFIGISYYDALTLVKSNKITNWHINNRYYISHRSVRVYFVERAVLDAYDRVSAARNKQNYPQMLRDTKRKLNLPVVSDGHFPDIPDNTDAGQSNLGIEELSDILCIGESTARSLLTVHRIHAYRHNAQYYTTEAAVWEYLKKIMTFDTKNAISVKDFAKQGGFSKSKALSLIRNGIVDAVFLDGQYRIFKESADAYLTQSSVLTKTDQSQSL